MKGVGSVRAYKVKFATTAPDASEGVGTPLISPDDETQEPKDLGAGGSDMASKDKGGKSEKKEAKKSLKEKRASKKEKKK